ncbi:MAG: radical SAM protein [Deltaproteobacteria bacterium]|nr:radical SAM protein [Deltaproteobacteria bacterium]
MESESVWGSCRFLTASVLPVARACNLRCPFCFSRSSISALERTQISELELDEYFAFARERGASRLVVTGGGEPLLRPELVLEIVEAGRAWFDEIACFTNGTFLTARLADALAERGLTYLCWSRHHDEDVQNKRLMGADAPALDDFLTRAARLPVRATCVMTSGAIETKVDALRYAEALRAARARTWAGDGPPRLELTFKHTYVSYPGSLFGGSAANEWSRAHRVAIDPFEGDPECPVVAELPWGPKIRDVAGLRTCFYYEPTPLWEKDHRICRSANLMADGRVFASLEDAQSELKSWRHHPS